MPLKLACACVMLVVVDLGAGCGGDEDVDKEAARPALPEQGAHSRKSGPDARPLLAQEARIPLAAPAGDSCKAHESLTILLDGDRSVDPVYKPEGSQPSVVLGLTEGDGVGGLLVEDLGDHAPALEYNLDAWLTRWRIEESTYPRRALLISHPHTIGRMILPGKSPQRVEEGPAVLDWTLRRLGDASLTSPNFADLCDAARRDVSWPVAPACERPFHDLEPGLTPLVWGDGTPSQRVFLYTYAISPVEIDQVPFQPLETVLIVSAPPGYLLYSVCSHLPMDHSQEHPAPFHVAYRVRERMDAGGLEPGPIHTVITGTCGVLRTFEPTASKSERGAFDTAEFGRRAAQMREDLGIQRLYLSHCGLMRTSQHSLQPFLDAYGGRIGLAYPGACIPLRPPASDHHDP